MSEQTEKDETTRNPNKEKKILSAPVSENLQFVPK